MPTVIKNLPSWLRRDRLRVELGAALHLQVSPSMIRDYALPDYVRLKRLGPKPLRRLLGIDLFYRFVRSRAPLVLPGDWDLHATPVAETPTHRFIAELVAAGYDYRATAAYARMIAEIDSGKAIRHKKSIIDSRDKVEAHFAYYCGVCRSMAADGYRRESARDPLCVMIGRHGNIVKEEKGRHRLAVAQLVGVPMIPVWVRHIHPLWVEELRRTFPGSAAEAIRAGLQRLDIS